MPHRASRIRLMQRMVVWSILAILIAVPELRSTAQSLERESALAPTIDRQSDNDSKNKKKSPRVDQERGTQAGSGNERKGDGVDHAPDNQDGNSDPQAGSKKEKDSVDADLPLHALVGAKVHTMGSRGVVDNAVVLIRGDKIQAVEEAGFEIPKDALKIDVTGMVVTPGLIDAQSELWLTRPAASAYASDASLNVVDGIDAFTEEWKDTLRQGVTSVYIQPASRGTLGGYGAVLSVVPEDGEPVLLREYAALQASIGVGASSNRVRQQQLDRTKKVLNGAKAYQKKWDEYNEYLKKQKKSEGAKDQAGDGKSGASQGKKKTSENPANQKTRSASSESIRRRGRPPGGTRRPPGGSPPGSRTAPDDSSSKGSSEKTEGSGEKKGDEKEVKPPEKPDRDPAKDRLVRVLKGNIPVRLEVHNADDVHYGIQLLEEFKDLQVVFAGLSDLGSAAGQITKTGSPVVLGPWLEANSVIAAAPDRVLNWNRDFGDYGGALSIASVRGARGSRFLRAHLGMAQAGGVATDRILRAVTMDAARSLGIGDQLGSIEVGKQADLVAHASDPLSAATVTAMVMVRGKVVYQSETLLKPSQPQRLASEMNETSLADSPPWRATFALRTTRFLMPDGTFKRRLIEVQEGRVVRQASYDSQSEFEIVDLGDSWVTPGLFTAHANLGLQNSIDPRSQVDSGYIVAGDSVASGFESERELVKSGILCALLVPGDANPVAGAGSLLRLGADEPVWKQSVASKIVLSDEARSVNRFPSSLAGQIQLVRQSLKGELLESRVYLPETVRERLESKRSSALKALKDGHRPVLIRAETDAEIRAALQLVDSYRFKAWLVGPEQLKFFAERIRQSGVGVIARPLTGNDYDWYLRDLAEVSRLGVPVLFSGENAVQLRMTAALAVEAGMEPSAALASLFYGASHWQKTTQLTNGQFADLVVWSHPPLHLGAQPLRIVVNGKVVQE